jgi:hypothetical protein
MRRVFPRRTRSTSSCRWTRSIDAAKARVSRRLTASSWRCSISLTGNGVGTRPTMSRLPARVAVRLHRTGREPWGKAAFEKKENLRLSIPHSKTPEGANPVTGALHCVDQGLVGLAPDSTRSRLGVALSAFATRRVEVPQSTKIPVPLRIVEFEPSAGINRHLSKIHSTCVVENDPQEVQSITQDAASLGCFSGCPGPLRSPFPSGR